MPSRERNSLARLGNSNRAPRRQSLRQLPRKHRRHMLHDHNRHRKIVWNRRQHFRKRSRSARGRPYRHNLNSPPARPQNFRRQTRRARSGRPAPFSAQAAKRLDLRYQLRPNILPRLRRTRRVIRLRRIIRSAQGQRLQRCRRSSLRQRAVHNHRQPRINLAYLRQCLQAAHPLHLDIERNQIRVHQRQFPERRSPIASRSAISSAGSSASVSQTILRTTIESSTTNTRKGLISRTRSH